MIDFSWNIFTQTGDLESYLLYKYVVSTRDEREYPDDEEEEPLDSLS
jgi:hypothetical protein